MNELDRLFPPEVRAARKRRLEAMRLQEIEGNPLGPDDVVMFEMFEREAWTHERRDVVFEFADHRHYPDSRAGLSEGQAVRLARDPTNAHDPCAVRIEADGRLIGFVNRFQAPTVGPLARHAGGEARGVMRAVGGVSRDR